VSSNDVIRMVNAIRSVSRVPRQDTMIYGVVVSTEPLKIDIGHDIILTEDFLFLGQMCRPHKVKIPHTHKINQSTEYSSTGITAETIDGTEVVVTDPSHNHSIRDKETDDVHKDGCGTDYEEYVVIEIHPKLKIGDKVLMFAFNNFQMYYVAERMEED